MSSQTLVVAPSWVGDMMMAQPLLARIATQDPSGKVDVLAPAFIAGMCERLPGVGRIHPSPFAHGELRLAERWRLGRRLHALGYQRAFVLPNSLKSALVPFFAGIPERIGYLGESRHGLLNDARRLDMTAVPRMVDRYFQLGFTRSQLQSAQPAPDPVLAAQREGIEALLARLELQAPDPAHRLPPPGTAGDAAHLPHPLILCPGAEFGPAKRWPVRHFAAVASHALGLGTPVWILGSGKDQPVGEDIRRHGASGAANLCGRTTLADAIDLMALAQGVVSNDSGLMHVAAALGVRTVALFGSSSAGFTPPLSKRAQALSLALPCSPCFKRECPLGHLDCLEKLLPDTVIAALRDAAAPGANPS